MLQILNSDQNHSVRAAKLIGIYEGEKENRECIEHIFGPVIKELQTFSKNIKDYHLQCPTYSSQSYNVSSVNNADDFLTIKGMSNCPSEIRRLDPSNKIKSPVCKLRVHGHGTIKISDAIFHDHHYDSLSMQSSENHHSLSKDVSTSSTISLDSQPEKESKNADEFSECLLVLGGDWQWMASIYGYTGPNGVHFVKTVR